MQRASRSSIDTGGLVSFGSAPAWAAAAWWLAACVFSLATFQLHNDHFGRISPARQIAVYGELPFRDYFDPGYFGAEVASAGLQRLLGDNLLGELLLTTTCIAAGSLIVLLLGARMSGSTAAGAAAAALTLLSMPRPYDYDKCLFYPLGVLLCWRYVDRRSSTRIWLLALGLVAGALFRYDTGVFIGAAAIVTIAVVHAGTPEALARRLALLIVAVVCLGLPYLIYLHLNGGVFDALDQMWTYAMREGAGTRLSSITVLPSLLKGVPLIAGVVLALDVRSTTVSRDSAARVGGLLAMAVMLNVFILREPVIARLGGIVAPAAILSVWLACRACRVRATLPRRACQGMVLVFLALATWSLSSAADWNTRLVTELRPAHVRDVITLLATTPSNRELASARQLGGVVDYLRDCTHPADRVFAAGFHPELFFLAQRGFAGGIAAAFGRHWSEPRFERRSLEILESQRVPVVIGEPDRFIEFRDQYPLLAEYFDTRFRVAVETSFGNPEGPRYTVLVDRRRTPTRIDERSSLPCFAG